MIASLVIIGCGGFGREVFNIVDAVNQGCAQWSVEGFIDDGPRDEDLERVLALGSRHLGSVSDLAHHVGSINAVVAIGNAAARCGIVARLADASVTYPVVLHPQATIGAGVIVGPGSIIAAGARLSANIVVEQHVQIDQNVTVGHDAHIHDYARLNPQACISGAVKIGVGALIGANATILQGLCVGDHTVVGAAACVVRNVHNGATVRGVPAR